MKTEEIKKLLESFGWEQIASRNKFMVSFGKNDRRLNFYRNKTITIQGKTLTGIYKKNVETMEQLERIIQNI